MRLANVIGLLEIMLEERGDIDMGVMMLPDAEPQKTMQAYSVEKVVFLQNIKDKEHPMAILVGDTNKLLITTDTGLVSKTKRHVGTEEEF